MGWLFGRPVALVEPSEALAGGRHPVLPEPAPHAVLGTPIEGPWEDSQQVVWLGLGCFWGAEQLFWQLDGVVSTAVGYAGGITQNPTYREVCSGRTNHTEVVQVVFDPQRISVAELVAKALEAHDPTQGYRQGNDVGTQYRSAVYVASKSDQAVAEELVRRYGEKLREHGFSTITTEVALLSDTPAGAFFLAEDEHQQYLFKNPGGYCPHHSTGVACGVEPVEASGEHEQPGDAEEPAG